MKPLPIQPRTLPAAPTTGTAWIAPPASGEAIDHGEMDGASDAICLLSSQILS